VKTRAETEARRSFIGIIGSNCHTGACECLWPEEFGGCQCAITATAS
jgi:hypothetical protein